MTFKLLQDSKSWKPGRVDSYTNGLSSKSSGSFLIRKNGGWKTMDNVFNMLKVEQRLPTKYSLTKVLKIKGTLRPSHVKRKPEVIKTWLVLDKDRHVSECSRVPT